MNIGMLWFDNDPKADLDIKVQRAATYYWQKYGKAPDVCYVHPSMLAAEYAQHGKIEIRASRSVLPYHLWIGVQQAGAAESGRAG
jgi:hypothetical protein